MTARTHSRPALAALALGCALALTPCAQAQDRDVTTILEEQELLRRQVQRLRRTIEALIPRLEQEGRPRALELLKEGLQLLQERSEGAGRLTLEELMDKVRQDVQSGQIATSLAAQEQIIKDLERLLSVLLDRRNVDELGKSIEQLEQIRKDLGALEQREKDLIARTEQLREESRTPEQKQLAQTLEQLAAQQRELLERNERAGRQSGAHALEQLTRELEQLAQQQEIDAQVLESWNPEAAQSLEQAEIGRAHV